MPSVMTLTEIAKAQLLAYNEKNWEKFRAAVTSGFVYEEFASGTRAVGVDNVLSVLRAWAKAIPDSKGTLINEYVSGTTVVLELTWNGTQTGPLQTPNGEIAPTGKPISVRACQVIEIANDRAKSVRQYFDMGTLLRQIGAV